MEVPVENLAIHVEDNNMIPPSQEKVFDKLKVYLKHVYDQSGNRSILFRFLFDNVKNLSSESTDVKASNDTNESELQLTQNYDDWFSDFLKEQFEKKVIKEVKREVKCVQTTDGSSFHICDISIKCRGADDTLYAQEPLLRKYLPRGLSLLRVENADGTEIVDCVTHAIRKFSGATLEDEDDGRPELCEVDGQNIYFLKSQDEAARVISMEKINGEAAHICGRYVNGVFYFIAGSKNVRMMFRNEEDLDQYTDERYAIAQRIARTVLRQWKKLTEFKRDWLQKFLHFTKTTMAGEIKLPDHQHIVSFDGMTKEEIIFIGLTSGPEENPKSVLVFPADIVLEFYKIIGFKSADYEIVGVSDVSSSLKEVRARKKTEGVVIYFEDKDQNVIGLIKVKSRWYIHLRALRQQAASRFSFKKSKSTRNMDQAKERSRQRMEELKQWLQTSDDELKFWQDLSDLWMVWIETKVKNEEIDPLDIRNNFPVVWTPFTKSPAVEELLESKNLGFH